QEVLEGERTLLEKDQAVAGTHHYAKDQPPLRDHEIAGCNDHLGESRQVSTKTLEHILELWDDEDQQNCADQNCDCNYCGGIEKRLLDLALQGLRVLLVGSNGVEHGFQDAG